MSVSGEDDDELASLHHSVASYIDDSDNARSSISSFCSDYRSDDLSKEPIAPALKEAKPSPTPNAKRKPRLISRLSKNLKSVSTDTISRIERHERGHTRSHSSVQYAAQYHLNQDEYEELKRRKIRPYRYASEFYRIRDRSGEITTGCLM